MSAKNLIEYIENKKILILGFGREGKSTYSFIRRYLPEKKLTVGDRNTVTLEDGNTDFIFGENYLDSLGDFDLVFKSPGIPFIGVDYPETTEITCQTDMFLRFADCVTVGVTGTKGKTTTSTLIFNMLREAGLNASLIGNIGVPVLEDIDKEKDAVAVIEMSSHQLEFTKTSPHVAVITNIYEEHLDHYARGFEGYVGAKLNIVKHQSEGDFFIYNGTQGLKEYLDTEGLKCKKIPVYAEGDDFVASLSTLNNNLRGKHNSQDIGFAAAAARCMGAENWAIRAAVEKFQGIPNRMEFFGTFGGVDYYNDSIATIPQAVLCAVDAIDNIGTLIIGGMDRGIDYSQFEKALANAELDNIVCLPQTGHKIADALTALGCKANVVKVADLPGGVKAAVELTQKGKACIMSPAAASYNVYRDFEEKGNHFKQLVLSMTK